MAAAMKHIPKLPKSNERVDCFLEIDGLKNAFWIDMECTPNRIRRMLNELLLMDVLTTRLWWNDVELTQEKTVVSYGVKHGDVIRVTYDKKLRTLLWLIQKPKKITENVYKHKECIQCLCQLRNEDSMIFVPCGHVCVCRSCSLKVTKCPICVPAQGE